MVRFDPSISQLVLNFLVQMIPCDNENQNSDSHCYFLLNSSGQIAQIGFFFELDMAIYHTTGVSHLVPVVCLLLMVS